MPDYDDPSVEERWCIERRTQVIGYLQEQGVEHGRVGEWPAWHVAPYVSVWAIESKRRSGWVGWWTICGDLPTDYISAATVKHPRDALRTFAKVWEEVAARMEKGEEHDCIRIGRPSDWPTLAPLLLARSQLLRQFADDNDVWVDDERQ
jgi:hypothetical protein